MRRSTGLLATLAAAITAPAAGQIVLETEDFNDGDAATRWTVVSSEEVNSFTNASTGETFEIVAPPDFAVTFDFDYSVLGLIPGADPIPLAPGNAPGDTSTTAVYFQSNLTPFTPDSVSVPTEVTDDMGNTTIEDVSFSVFEGAGVGAFLNGLDLPDTYRLTADMYYAQLGLGGSTEWAAIGVHHQGTDETPVPFVGDGDGLAWTTSTDTDTSFNLRAYEAPPGGPTIDEPADGFPTPPGTSGLTYANVPAGAIPGVTTGTEIDPDTGDEVAIPGAGIMNQWVTLEVVRNGDLVQWFINGTLIDEASGAGFDGGSVLIGNADAFDSVAPDFIATNELAFVGTPFQAEFEELVAAVPDGLTLTNGAIFDNIVITVPEPAAGVLLALAAMAAAARRGSRSWQ